MAMRYPDAAGAAGRDRGAAARRATVAAFAAAALGAGCASPRGTLAEQRESFDSAATYSRGYAAGAARTCEAARRALLSQGYVIVSAGAELVHGRKHFQPKGDVHIEVDFRVVCAAAAGDGGAIAFASALQDRYALKKSASSASVGVGMLGSVSLPLVSSDDSLVKVASETITGAPFYDRFFALIERYLPTAPPELRAPAAGRGVQAVQPAPPAPPPPAASAAAPE